MKNTPEIKPFEVVSITNHQREWEGKHTIKHTANAVILNYDPSSEKELAASQVSIKAGYHPAGYGIYHRYTVIKPTGNENEYSVNWQTSASCD